MYDESLESSPRISTGLWIVVGASCLSQGVHMEDEWVIAPVPLVKGACVGSVSHSVSIM